MREIKFRAWSKSENKMLENIFITSGMAWDKHKETHVNIPNDAIFLQYTGLKAKNGQEIYKGDIVKIPIDAIGEVVCGIPKTSDQYIYWVKGDGFLGSMDIIMEVLGNICENSELLGKNNGE